RGSTGAGLLFLLLFVDLLYREQAVFEPVLQDATDVGPALRLVQRGTTHGFDHGVEGHAVCQKAVDLFVVRAVRQASVCLRENLSEFGPLLVLARARVIIIIIFYIGIGIGRRRTSLGVRPNMIRT